MSPFGGKPLSSCTNLFLQVAENGHFIWSFPSREIHVYGCLKELQNDKVGLTPWASIKYLIVSSAGSQFMLLMTKTRFATHRSDCISMRKLETFVEELKWWLSGSTNYLPAGHCPWSWDNRWNAKQWGNDV